MKALFMTAIFLALFMPCHALTLDLPFFDDMEEGPDNWDADGDWARLDTLGYGGGACWTDSPHGNYSDGSNHTLTLSVNLDFTEARYPRLVFRDRYSFTYYDHGYVEISTDLGLTWETVFDHCIFTNMGWNPRTVDLRRYAGSERIKIRFRVDARSHSSTADGWYIDDVLVEDKEIRSYPIPVFDTVEKGPLFWEADGSWAVDTTSSWSGRSCWTDSPGANYSDGYNYTLTLADNLDLTSAESPRLEFMDRYSFTYYDRGIVEVSVDLGETWEEVFTHYLFTNLDWNPRTADLTPYAGNPYVKIRFRVNATSHSSTADGWFLDDIRVFERGDGVATLPVLEDFESDFHWEADGDWARTSGESYSGSMSVTDSPGANYADGHEFTLTMGCDISLAGTLLNPKLSFRDMYSLTYYDRAIVEISTGCDSIWRNIHEHYLFTNLSWGLKTVDLREFIGVERARFRLKLKATSHSSTADGWYVDDILIRDKPVVCSMLPFADDCENDYAFFEAEGDWVLSDECAFSGDLCWVDSPGANYADGSNHTLTMTDNLDLSSSIDPKLTFQDRYSFTYYDHGYVEVSTDLGVTWETVFDHYLSGNMDWNRRTVDLLPYRGVDNVKIRFRVDATSHSSTADGWYIDDILVVDREYDPPVVIFVEPPFDVHCGTGERMWFGVGAENRTELPQRGEAWTTVIAPDSSETLIAGPTSFRLEPGQRGACNLHFDAAAEYLPGVYEAAAFLGEYPGVISGRASFLFVIEG